jgi:hypothetical protein
MLLTVFGFIIIAVIYLCIDIDKTTKTGTIYHSNSELQKYMGTRTKHPGNVTKWFLAQDAKINPELESLFEGRIPAHAIDTRVSMNTKRFFSTGGRYFGNAMTVWDFGTAGVKSYNTGSASPLLAEGIRQASSYGGFSAGFAAGTAATAWLNLGGLPGTAISLGVGLAGGTIGYFFGDKVADQIDSND